VGWTAWCEGRGGSSCRQEQERARSEGSGGVLLLRLGCEEGHLQQRQTHERSKQEHNQG
jgi:hypothetical protein